MISSPETAEVSFPLFLVVTIMGENKGVGLGLNNLGRGF